MSRRTHFLCYIILLTTTVLLFIGCGPNEAQILATADARIQQAIASIPTATPQPTATPMPTATPYYTQALATAQAKIQQAISAIPTATPQPTATPVNLVDLNAIYSLTRQSVFYVETTGGHGTGWLLESGHILTAYHVVANYSNVTIRQGSGAAFPGTVLAFDSKRDIALISFNVSSANLSIYALPLTLGNISTANNASPLIALGYGGSGVKSDGSVGAPSVHAGILAQITDMTSIGLGDNLKMDLLVGPGDSGGPVLDSNGWVVGMTRAIDAEQIGTSYAVHVDEIRAALPDLRAGRSR